MVVGLRAAADAHLALSLALARVWTQLSSVSQQSVLSELKSWDLETYTHSSAGEHLQYLQGVLGSKLRGEPRRALVEARVSTDDVLSAIYDRVSVLVFALYAAWPNERGPVPLKVDRVNDPQYQGPIPIGACGAAASYGLDAVSRTPTVQLTVCPSHLGPPTVATLPYLLCHELICHAYQGADHRNDDPFAEGWMDRVSLALAQVWSGCLFPLAAQLARDESAQLSELLRMNLSGLPRPQPWSRASRRQGWAAAGVVKEWLRPFEKFGSAPGLFEQLSIELNRVRCTVGQRMAFVSAVQLSEEDASLRCRLSLRLRAWVEGTTDARAVLHFAD